MKKVIAVLLAMLMLCSVMAVAFSAFAADDETTTTAAVQDETSTEETSTEETKTEETSNWFTELVNRLIEVFTKLFAKLGLKFAIKSLF